MKRGQTHFDTLDVHTVMSLVLFMSRDLEMDERCCMSRSSTLEWFCGLGGGNTCSSG